jgi:hypothetical protein
LESEITGGGISSEIYQNIYKYLTIYNRRTGRNWTDSVLITDFLPESRIEVVDHIPADPPAQEETQLDLLHPV